MSTVPAGKSWTRRFAWMAAIWAASVAALGLVALVLHALMHAAALSSG